MVPTTTTSNQSPTSDRAEWESFLKFMRTQFPDEEKYDRLLLEISAQYYHVEPILIQTGSSQEVIALVNKGVAKLKAGSNNPHKILYKIREALNETAEKSEHENLASSSRVCKNVPNHNDETGHSLKNSANLSNGTEHVRSESEMELQNGKSAPKTQDTPSSKDLNGLVARKSDGTNLRQEVDEKLQNPSSPRKRKLSASCMNGESEPPEAKSAKLDKPADNPNAEHSISESNVSNQNEPGPSGSSTAPINRGQMDAPGPSRAANNDETLAIGWDQDYSRYSANLRGKILDLEILLDKVHRKIHKLESNEMSLEDMKNDSIYLLIDKYKKKGLQIYLKLQELKKLPSTLHRKQYKTIPYKGSQYSELNSMITSLINKDIDAPDFVEVLSTVKKFNDRHFKFLNVETAAQKIFREVVKLFKKRRCYDLRDVFSNKQIDLTQLKNDPAIGNKDLQNKLKENKLLCKDEKEILQQFTEASEVALKLCNVDADKVSQSVVKEKFPKATSIFVKEKACFLGFDKKTDLDECLASVQEAPVEIDGKTVELERVVLSGGAGSEETSGDASNEEEPEEFEENDGNEMDAEDGSNNLGGQTTAKVEPNEFFSDMEEDNATEVHEVELDIFGFPLCSPSNSTNTASETSGKHSQPTKTQTEAKQVNCSEEETSSGSKLQTSTGASVETSSKITATTDKLECRDSSVNSQTTDTDSTQSKPTANCELNGAKSSDLEKECFSGNACIIVDDDDDIICLDD